MGVASKKARGGRLVRTNVVLDDTLVRKAMKLTGINTKRGVLDEALRTLVRLREQEGIWDLYGRVEWEGDLQEMRKGRVFDGDR
jgi:Arc/MetJ family transcription regulator